MNISIGERWEKFVEKSVEDGHYGSASEVVQAGLQLVAEREAKIAVIRQELQQAIDAGGSISDEEMDAILDERAAELAKAGF
jgi:antitoxin ParD1/3/4